MGRGRAGGGGRSSGGGSRGGSRSSGGHRSSSSSRGGFSSSSRSSSSFSSPPRGGGYHSAPPPPPPRSRHHHTVVYHDYGPDYQPPRKKRSILSTILTLIFIIVFLRVATMLIFSLPSGTSTSITASTIEREKLDSQYVITTDYYEDHIGWIESGSRLKSGMKSFFDKTGVQPYLYLVETVNGSAHPSDAEMEAFAENLYDELFEDEGHLLVVFQEYDSDGQYFCWCVAGKQAKTVFDNEARDIFFDYLDSYYYSDLDTSDFFSETFEKTGERMMEVTTSPIVTIIIVIAVIIVISILFSWWKKVKAQKNLEAEQTERILNTPMETLGSTDTSDLEKKYQ